MSCGEWARANRSKIAISPARNALILRGPRISGLRIADGGMGGPDGGLSAGGMEGGFGILRVPFLKVRYGRRIARVYNWAKVCA